MKKTKLLKRYFPVNKKELVKASPGLQLIDVDSLNTCLDTVSTFPRMYM